MKKKNIQIYIGRNKRLPERVGETYENERIVQFSSPGKDFITFTYELRREFVTINPTHFFSFYGSKSEQLRWYEVSLRIQFLAEFVRHMREVDTHDIREIEREIQFIGCQKLLILIEKIFSCLKIPSSLKDGQEIFVFRAITDQEIRQLRKMMSAATKEV
jgi:hypothetical protein